MTGLLFRTVGSILFSKPLGKGVGSKFKAFLARNPQEAAGSEHGEAPDPQSASP